MLTLTLTDYLSRGWFTAPGGSTSAGAIAALPSLSPPRSLSRLRTRRRSSSTPVVALREPRDRSLQNGDAADAATIGRKSALDPLLTL